MDISIYEREMDQLARSEEDPVELHRKADEILVEVLRGEGHDELCDLYDMVSKNYY